MAPLLCQSPRLPAFARLAAALVVLGMVGLLSAACANPRVDGPRPAPNGEVQRPEPAPPARLAQARQVGDRYRTTRLLRVTETAESGAFTTESEETSLTTVLRIDESGRMLSVRRSFESSVTRFSRDGRRFERAEGDLHGSTLELTQQMSGVQARVLAGPAEVGRMQFVIEGFDAGLLPIQPVARGARWTLDGRALSGLTRIIETLDFRVERNRLDCLLAELDAERAVVSLDWRLTGEYRGRPAAMRFSGELHFDRRERLITRFELRGGGIGAGGPDHQIEIHVTRSPVTGWLDLD